MKPLDTDALLAAAYETRGMLTAEQHSIIGRLGEAVAGFVAEARPAMLPGVGVHDVFGASGTVGELLTLSGLRAAGIVAQASQIMTRKAVAV